MIRTLRPAIVLVAGVLIVPATYQTAKGTPQESNGLFCAACHNEASPDVLTVNGTVLTGGLETFQVESGDTVQLSFDVTEPSSGYDEFEYMFGIGGLELSGLAPELGSIWEYRPGDSVSYVSEDDHEGSQHFTLDVAVDASMSAGNYTLFAVVAGENEETSSKQMGGMSSGEENHIKWSHSQAFILQVTSAVIPEPSTMTLLLTLVASSLGVRFRRNTFGMGQVQM